MLITQNVAPPLLQKITQIKETQSAVLALVLAMIDNKKNFGK
jgi:hypothetical protein